MELKGELSKRKSWTIAIVMTGLLMMTTFFTQGVIWVAVGQAKGATAIITIAVWAAFGFLFFFMNASDKINKIRTLLFFVYAAAFTFSFISDLYEMRHHLYFVTFENFSRAEVPFCHIAITQSLPSVLFSREISFPGTIIDPSSHYGIGSMFILVMAASLLLGRGWCSWACFYGGWEDGMSFFGKKVKIKKLPRVLLYLPFAILITTGLISFLTVSPVYCNWLCPFKGVSEVIEVVSPLVAIQTVIFSLLFIGLCIVIPLLSKKRTQCAFFCPFGALQSLVDKINPFAVRINKEKCIKCGKCMRVCPMMSIEKENLETGKVKINCVKCGRCMDACPVNAISYHIKGTRVESRVFYFIAKYTFRYLGFFLMATMAGGMINSSLFRIYNLITTGSILIGS